MEFIPTLSVKFSVHTALPTVGKEKAGLPLCPPEDNMTASVTRVPGVRDSLVPTVMASE